MTILFAKIIILIFTKCIIRTHIGGYNRIYGYNLARVKSGQTRLRNVFNFKSQNISGSNTETSEEITSEELFGAKINTPKKIGENADKNKSINTCKPAKNKLWKKSTGTVKDKVCSLCTSVKKYTSYARGKLSDWRQILCAEIEERSERIPTKRTLDKVKHNILLCCKANKEVIIKDVINTIKTIGRLRIDNVVNTGLNVYAIFNNTEMCINLCSANIKRNLQARIIGLRPIGLRPGGTPREGFGGSPPLRCGVRGFAFAKGHHKEYFSRAKHCCCAPLRNDYCKTTYFPLIKNFRHLKSPHSIYALWGFASASLRGSGVRLRFAAGFVRGAPRPSPRWGLSPRGEGCPSWIWLTARARHPIRERLACIARAQREQSRTQEADRKSAHHTSACITAFGLKSASSIRGTSSNLEHSKFIGHFRALASLNRRSYVL